MRATRYRVTENLFTRGLETGEDVIETFADGRRATVLDTREDENEKKKTVELLTHVNKRTNGLREIEFPLEGLIEVVLGKVVERTVW